MKFTTKPGGVLVPETLSALLLAPESPYPLAGGGALRTASLLHYLRRKYEVDLIVFREPGAPDPILQLPSGLIRRIDVVDLPAHRNHFLARALRNAVRMGRAAPPLLDRFAGFGRQIEAILRERHYDLGIIEHFWCAPYHEQVAPACSRTVLDLHNIESELHYRCAAVEGYAAAFGHHIFRQACLDLERDWLPRFSLVLTPSIEDADRARRIAPDTHVSVFPNSIPAVPLPPHGNEEVVVYSGNLRYHPNQTAARYFRNAIWPALRERWPKLVWRLIGKHPEAVHHLIAGDSRIELQGPVDDAIREIARGRIAVVPVLAGSGTRLKILEAWAAGLPVVSTSIGAEGLPVRDGQHLLLADNPADFIAAVSRLLACSTLAGQIGNAGRLLQEKEFTWETVWQSLNF